MVDTQGYRVDAPIDYRIALLRDEPPTVALTRPGRDLVLPPEASVEFAVTAQDRYGLALRLIARLNDSQTPKTLQEWPAAEKPVRQADVSVGKTLAELGLKSGDHLQYWAMAEDRNPGTPEQPGPGRAQSRVFHLSVVSPEQAQQILNQQINDFSKAIAELIKLQRQNRGETATQLPARGLVERQGLIVRQTGRIADAMQQAAFRPPRSSTSCAIWLPIRWLRSWSPWKAIATPPIRRPDKSWPRPVCRSRTKFSAGSRRCNSAWIATNKRNGP